jgi:hypothetical protein
MAAEPVVVDFAPHRIRYAGYDGTTLWIASREYPLAFALALDADGRIVRTASEVPALKIEDASSMVAFDGIAIQWSGAERVAIADNARGGRNFRRFDWELIALAGPDAFVFVGPSRFLLIPFAYRPAGRVDVRRVHHDLDEVVGAQSLEDATVVFAGPERVLVEHERRGRFWLDVPKTGLTKGDRVRIGGFFSEHGPLAAPGEPWAWFAGAVAGHKIIATVIAIGDDVIRLPRPPVPDEGEKVHFGHVEKAPKKAARVPKALRDLVKVLVAQRLAPKPTKERLAEITESLDCSSDDDIEEHTTANLLAELHEEGNTGLAHGFIAHDWRFGNETADALDEYLSALGADAPPRAELHFRAGDDGLDALARRLNRELEARGARTRIFTLVTAGDWTAHIVRTSADVEAMKAKGVRGIALP